MDAHSCLTFLRWSEDELPLLVCLIITHISAVEQPQQKQRQQQQQNKTKTRVRNIKSANYLL